MSRNPQSIPATLIPVRSAAQMFQLLRESVPATGWPGRVFVIAGADRLSYRVLCLAPGFVVQRLDCHGRTLHSRKLFAFEFLQHSLHEAMHSGQLYTPRADTGRGPVPPPTQEMP